jgi:methyl-accepting chemotaxis protein
MALRRIASMVTATTNAATDISVATRQQRTASEHVVQSMTEVAAASDRYAAGARASSAAAAELTTLAEGLTSWVSAFKTPAPLTGGSSESRS